MSKNRKKCANDYETGYGKPPVAFRFEPGKSGNPKGRPRGSRNMRTMLKEILDENIVIHLNGTPQQVTFKYGFMRQVAARAAKGSAKDAALFFDFIRSMTPEELAEAERSLPTPDEQATIDRFAARAGLIQQAQKTAAAAPALVQSVPVKIGVKS